MREKRIDGMAPHLHQFICLEDNFGVLVHDPETRATAAIDAPDAAPILAALAAREWTLTDILLTHHHADHVQGVPGLKAHFPRAQVTGPAREAAKIGGLDRAVGEDDEIAIGVLEGRVIEVPGHTSGHVAYFFEENDLVFVGDTLFSLGCGRAFEEPARVLYHSLMRLAALPGATEVYCGHEYTLTNAKFALGVDPGNDILRERAEHVARLRMDGEYTLPTTIALECLTNPFLRAAEPELQAAVGMADADPADVFAELRARKNRA